MKKEKEVVDQATLLKHIKFLNLGSITDYRNWCNRYGFSRSLEKTKEQLFKELAIIRDQKVEEEMTNSKVRHQPILKILKDVQAGSPKISETKSHILSSVNAKLDKKGVDKKEFLFFLISVGEKSDLLSLDLTSPLSKKNSLDVLFEVFEYRFFWVKDLSQWNPQTHNIYKQFLSLIDHLFCKYKTPTFLFSSWFSNVVKEKDWFICLAQGDNFKTAGFPIELTKKQVHLFLQAPNDYTIPQALRYGQILGLNGDRQLVAAINNLDLSYSEFWTTVIQFFINNPMLDRYQVGPIVDYIKHQKFSSNAPEPNLSMKGRTADSLLKQVENWHAKLRKEKPKKQMEWKTSGIPGFEKVEGLEYKSNYRNWKITELLTSNELYAEGKTQKHCVGSYSYSASSGRVAIFSLRKIDVARQEEIVLTIEVNLMSKAIVQARKKYNERPDPKASEILSEWAGKVGLRLNIGLF